MDHEPDRDWWDRGGSGVNSEATSPNSTRHGYTPHGHSCCARALLEAPIPTQVARCGGPGICSDCSKWTAAAHRRTSLSDWPEDVPIPMSIWEDGFAKVRTKLEAERDAAVAQRDQAKLLLNRAIDIMLQFSERIGLHELHAEALVLLKLSRKLETGETHERDHGSQGRPAGQAQAESR